MTHAALVAVAGANAVSSEPELFMLMLQRKQPKLPEPILLLKKAISSLDQTRGMFTGAAALMDATENPRFQAL